MLYIKNIIKQELKIDDLTPVCEYVAGEHDYKDTINKVYKKFLFNSNNSIIKRILIFLHLLFK